MDAYILDHRHTGSASLEVASELSPGLAQWLLVSGDLDDFIYYGEEPRHSEK